MQELVDAFLGERSRSTSRAYRTDLDDFGRSMGVPAAVAVGRLLANGPDAARHMVLEFVVNLRARGLALATIDRRLKTLRAIAARARDQGIVDWTLEMPSDEEVFVRLRERATQASYLLPRHPSEVSRLDLQHYAVRGVEGQDFLAPVETVGCVLDVGAGTGQWGFDICARFRRARVIGLDLVACKPGAPVGYRSVRGNILQGLPFQADRFDLVHQRFLVSGVPTAAWPVVIADIVRVTRPGGWVELNEPLMLPQQAGPATLHLWDLMLGIAEGLGLDTTGQVYRKLEVHLGDAGLTGVTRRELTLPIGHWAGQVGAFMATDYRAAFTRICEVLEARSQLTEAEGRQLIERTLEECEEYRTFLSFAVAFGRKPGSPVDNLHLVDPKA